MYVTIQSIFLPYSGSCSIHHEDVNMLHLFQVLVSPEEGFWRGGKFRFDVHVPDEYNIVVSLAMY